MGGPVRQPSVTMRRVVELLRQRGVLHVAARAARRLSGPLVDVCRVTCYEYPLDVEPRRDDQPVPVRLATPADLRLVLEASDPRRTAAMLARRFERGDRCFLALDAAGRAVHSRWVSTERGYIPELGMDVALRAGEAYFYDGYTRADHRGKGVDSAVRRFIFAWLRGAGFARAYSYVRGDNPVGQRAAARWQSPTGTVLAVRLFGLQPVVFGHRRVARPLLVRREHPRGDDDDARRAQVARAWFESWCNEPLAKRSTGYHPVPDEYFAATAAYVIRALECDPRSDLVLDVGCDSAMVSRLVAPACRQLVGVDFVPGLLTGIPRAGAAAAVERRGAYGAADARFLPFRAGAFDKVYSAAMIHVLPSREDGLKAIDEMVRVCRPGGLVLVASVPDVRKRRRALADAWRRAGAGGKLALAAALLTPRPLRRLWHSLTGAGWDGRLVLLDYDLAALAARLEARGHRCEVLDFPAEYWSRDFRRSRSNLLIHTAPAAPVPSLQPDLLTSGHDARRA